MQALNQPPRVGGLLQKSITSGQWLSIGYLIQKSLSLTSFIILARLVPPDAFGIMALVLLVPRFIEAITDPGLGTTLIQRQEDIRPYLNPVWTIGVIKAALISIVIFSFGPMIAKFYHVETATLAIGLGGLFIFVLNLSNIGETYLFRDLNFKKIVIRDIVKDLSYLIVAVSIAFTSRSYWALFWGTLAQVATQTTATYFLQPYRPALAWNFRPLLPLLSYSKWIVGQGWLGQLYGFLETSTVARLLNPTAVGLYGKAKSMAAVAPGFLGPMIRNITFPAYAKLQEEKNKIVDGLEKTLHLVFFILVPLTLLILFAGGKLILIVLGPAWLPMTGAFRLLLLYFFITVINDIAQPLFNAIGRPDKQVKFDLIKILVTLTLIIPFTERWGIVGTAAAVLGGNLPVFILNLRALFQLTGLTPRAMLGTVLIPLSLSLLLLLPMALAKDYLIQQPSGTLLALTLIAALLYLVLTSIVGRRWNLGPWKTLTVICQHLR